MLTIIRTICRSVFQTCSVKQCFDASVQRHRFSSTALAFKQPALPPRPTVPEEEIEEVFIKGGGKGGQKINKTNSKVQLRHIPTGIVVSSQATRSREQNRNHARRELAEELEFLRDPENSRRAMKIKRLQKKKAGQIKKANRRQRERNSDNSSNPVLVDSQEKSKLVTDGSDDAGTANDISDK